MSILPFLLSLILWLPPVYTYFLKSRFQGWPLIFCYHYNLFLWLFIVTFFVLVQNLIVIAFQVIFWRLKYDSIFSVPDIPSLTRGSLVLKKPTRLMLVWKFLFLLVFPTINSQGISLIGSFMTNVYKFREFCIDFLWLSKSTFLCSVPDVKSYPKFQENRKQWEKNCAWIIAIRQAINLIKQNQWLSRPIVVHITLSLWNSVPDRKDLFPIFILRTMTQKTKV